MSTQDKVVTCADCGGQFHWSADEQAYYTEQGYANNAAERVLRRAVLWRRKSFGTKSATGSRFVERILTVVTSLRQQGRDVVDYLTAACASATHDGASICPLPDSS